MSEPKTHYGHVLNLPLEQRRQALLNDCNLSPWVKQVLEEQWANSPVVILHELTLLHALWLEKVASVDTKAARF
jgi:hypothetical protein